MMRRVLAFTLILTAARAASAQAPAAATPAGQMEASAESAFGNVAGRSFGAAYPRFVAST